MKVNQKNKVLNISNKQNQKSKSENTEEKDNKNIDDNKSLYTKITKPTELENFDTSSHLQHNIQNVDINCKDKITPQSYYCITCRQSVCTTCGAYDHKDHILIQRDNCLFYDPNFFVEISKIIDNALTIDSRKQSIKDSLEKSISAVKQHLDELKISKFKEIDEFFEKTINEMKNVKNNFLDAKNSIENYYKENKKFFNIKYNNEKMNIIEEETQNNLDIENTIFIMNFDLMNLCDSQNLKILDKVNEITNKINTSIDKLDKKSSELLQLINNHYILDINTDTYENYYDDIKIRIQKYSQIINQYKATVADIIKKNGNIDKIKELLEIFDSKNKKNKNIIFQQNFFQNEKNDNGGNITPRLSSNYSKDNEKMLNNCKSNNSISNNNNTDVKDNNNNLKVNIKNKGNRNNINSHTSKSAKKIINSKKEKSTQKSKSKILSENSSGNINNNYTVLSNRAISPNKVNLNDIILDNRIIQRFFSYSINDFYKQNFIIDTSNKISENKSNKNLKKKSKTNNIINNSKNKDTTKKVNNNNINKKDNTLNNNNNNNIEIDSSQYNIKSVAYLANYQNRYNSLKERAKPIIGTNQIQIFDQNQTTKKIIKKTTSLNKEEHGYSSFPDGCRHILINNILYITGGNNKCGHIVLSYDILSNKLNRLSNFINEHSFHTLEYIDNFDCIVCVGGENSSVCEIMDINSQQWKKLPSLNYPRANCSVFYNNITEQVYALFGLKGNLWDKNSKNSDKIEVLYLNNIDNGWVNLDYHKSTGIDFKMNFCKTMPFSKDKLIIFGGNNVRSLEEQNFYALFDMNKNEIIKVDKQTMELIKLEEKKMRLADFSLTKIN